MERKVVTVTIVDKQKPTRARTLVGGVEELKERGEGSSEIASSPNRATKVRQVPVRAPYRRGRPRGGLQTYERIQRSIYQQGKRSRSERSSSTNQRALVGVEVVCEALLSVPC